MSDGSTDAAAEEVDELHYNVARIGGEDCCAACFIQADEANAFRLVRLDDLTVVQACAVCQRGRVLERDDPFVAQRERWLAEGRVA